MPASPPSETERVLAKVIYDAYRAYTGGVSAVDRSPIPEWPGLPIQVQRAWCASARAAILHIGPVQAASIGPPTGAA
jgi:hypothetical protein